jgi:hypothetical protein
LNAQKNVHWCIDSWAGVKNSLILIIDITAPVENLKCEINSKNNRFWVDDL